jgi:hypothetical protein
MTWVTLCQGYGLNIYIDEYVFPFVQVMKGLMRVMFYRITMRGPFGHTSLVFPTRWIDQPPSTSPRDPSPWR